MTAMALVDKIEELGAAVDAGLLDPDIAVQQLVEYSDGGLTRLGAADMLARWQTARAAYSDIPHARGAWPGGMRSGDPPTPSTGLTRPRPAIQPLNPKGTDREPIHRP